MTATQAPSTRATTLTRKQRFLLGALGAMSFFEGYDRAIVTIALIQIRETFGLTHAEASAWLAIVLLGSLPAVGLSRLADRHGRRPLLLISVLGYTIATGATALAPTIGVYVGCQFAARVFLTTEAAVAWTLAAEELPAQRRGLGFGWLAMSAALGVGFGAILFGTVLEPAGLSWRWLYVIGLPPLAIVAAIRKRLPESARFIQAADERKTVVKSALFRPPHRSWLILAAATALLLQLTTQAELFAIDFLQSGRGLSTQTANVLLVGAGLPGIPIMVWAGSLSDHRGRRLVGCGFGLLSLAGVAAFFWLPGGVPVLLPSLTLVLVGQMAAWPVLAGYGAELFPTELRGQAGSWIAIARVVGSATSLGLGALLLQLTGGLPETVTLLALGPLAAIILVAMKFPDTHGVELEAIHTVPFDRQSQPRPPPLPGTDAQRGRQQTDSPSDLRFL